MTPKHTWKCSICGQPATGWGNNPQPIRWRVDDRCCDTCNTTVVIPARMVNLYRALEPKSDRKED